MITRITLPISIIISIIVLMLSGCSSSVPGYQSFTKKLFSWRIPKNEVANIREMILAEGYTFPKKESYTSCVDYATFIDCVTIYNYFKTLSRNNGSSDFQLVMTHKDTNPPSNFYRNFSITIYNLDNNNVHEIQAEIERMENLLYIKLIDVSESNNVVREKRN